MEKKLNRGNLILQDNDRLGAITKEFTCGSPVEVFIDGQLIKGTIEWRFDWSSNGEASYYLLGEDKNSYSLKDGMEVLFYD